MELNKIYNIDCVKGMRLLDDCSIDLTVTSPPYDNLRTYNGFTFDFESVAKELYRITKVGGVVVWVVSDQTIDGSESGTSFRQALYFKEIGFRLHDTMIYQKINFLPLSHNRYEPGFEFMFVLSKSTPTTFNPITEQSIYCGHKYNYATRDSGSAKEQNGSLRVRDETRFTKEMKVKSNIWAYHTGKNKGTKDDVWNHPATFPENLAQDHIISWSNEGDIVLDPFMGSGTTAKMAILNRRKFIGFEISEEYVKQANARIKPYQDQTSIFDFIELDNQEIEQTFSKD